jgi:hypothetical protein
MEIKFEKRIKQKKLEYLFKLSKKAHVRMLTSDAFMRGPCEVIHQSLRRTGCSAGKTFRGEVGGW